jgi:methyl acetate hydrolase
MGELDNVINNAVSAHDAPFLVAMVGNSDGPTWSGTAGDSVAGQPATLDTVFRIFSMTKSVGSTAAMILMERGKLSPDATVESILPEFADVQVLDGFGDDGPILHAPKVQATVRHLATHTSGLAYEFWNANMQRYMAETEHPSILSGLTASLLYPLQFEPGTRWDYGIGIDWLGRVVEAIDGRKIDQFCREEIFEPLGMTDTCFEVDAKVAPRLAGVKFRGEDGAFIDFDIAPPANPEFYGMGHALYSTALDYARYLRMYLNGGVLDGQRVLAASTIDTMLANQIGDLSIPRIQSFTPLSADIDLFAGHRMTHSMAFVRSEEDTPGMRHAGSQGWAGVLNSHYWFDPSANLFGLIMTQSLPFADPRFMATYEQFERAAYSSLA